MPPLTEPQESAKFPRAGGLCSCCRALLKMSETRPRYAVADHVKVEIGDERLWLRVNRCDDDRRLVFGTLESEPSGDYGGKVVRGSELVVSFSQIREYAKHGLAPFQPF